MKIKFRLFPSSIIPAIFACVSLLGYSSDSPAWGKDGHTAIGVLAINQVQPDALQALEEILQPLDRQTMEQACNWPDVIRETDEGAWSAPLHYVNIPRDSEAYSASDDCPVHPQHMAHPEGPARYCVTEAIKHYAAGLGDRQASTEQREQAFAWLCHLVGDLHQPLHAGFADDRGGNSVNVVFNDEEINLHRFWDSALIHQQAGSWQYLVGESGPFPVVHAASDWTPEMVDGWTNASHELAKASAYPATGTIDESFAQTSWEIIRQQINLAAERLALIINTEFQQED